MTVFEGKSRLSKPTITFQMFSVFRVPSQPFVVSVLYRVKRMYGYVTLNARTHQIKANREKAVILCSSLMNKRDPKMIRLRVLCVWHSSAHLVCMHICMCSVINVIHTLNYLWDRANKLLRLYFQSFSFPVLPILTVSHGGESHFKFPLWPQPSNNIKRPRTPHVPATALRAPIHACSASTLYS